MQRNLEYTIYKTTFAGMNGAQPFKNIKTPRDLYTLPSDKKIFKPVKIDRAQQAKAVNRVKQNKQYQEWQQKT